MASLLELLACDSGWTLGPGWLGRGGARGVGFEGAACVDVGGGRVGYCLAVLPAVLDALEADAPIFATGSGGKSMRGDYTKELRELRR